MTPKALALRNVIDGTRSLFHVLARSAEDLHEDLGLLASHRAVLETIVREGPAPVPAIARRKGVTRQHIQSVVNALVEQGLVFLEDNPSHRRSPIVQLTKQGHRLFTEVQQREAEVLGKIAANLRRSDLVLTETTMKAIAKALQPNQAHDH